MTSILDRYPKQRPPLPQRHRDIYERHYVANRTAAYRTTTVSSRLEAWMHRRVAADARDGNPGATLEIGAGTLNHLPHEPTTAPYDVVEPFARLLAESPTRHRIRHVYPALEDVPGGHRYRRIVSIATFEHLTDLPAIVAGCGLLLAADGVLRVGIPNEGTILWRLGTAVTGGEFRLRYGLDYQTLMRHEHVNTADEIEAVLRCCFGSVRTAVCGIHRRIALYRFLECRRPDLAVAARVSADRAERCAA
jgi:hypothetical protein